MERNTFQMQISAKSEVRRLWFDTGNNGGGIVINYVFRASWKSLRQKEIKPIATFNAQSQSHLHTHLQVLQVNFTSKLLLILCDNQPN